MATSRTRKTRILAGTGLVFSLLIWPAVSAHAQLIDVQTQLRYDYQAFKDRGEAPSDDGNLVLGFNLGLRQPLIPTSSFVTGLTFNSAETADTNGRQSNRNLELSLHRREVKYTFSGRVARREFANKSGLGSGSSEGFSNEYTAAMLLREPAWPVLNVQYRRNTAGSSFGGSDTSRTTNTWLMSSYYDLSPLRFTYDRSQQSYNSPGASTSRLLTQRSSVYLNHAIMNGLTLTGELGKNSIRNSSGTSSLSTDSTRRLVRLSMTPTRAVTADLEYSLQSNVQDGLAGVRRNNNKGLTLNMRSQVMPGLAMNYSQQRQSQSGSSSVAGAYASRSMGFDARLGEGTFLNGSMSRATYDATSTVPSSEQDSLQVAVQTELTPRTDLSLTYSQNDSRIGADDSFAGSSAAISLRDRGSDKLSTGISYRRSEIDAFVAGGGNSRLTTNAIDVDALWIPTSDVGLNFRLSFSSNNGSDISETIEPAFDLRWRLDSSTNLSLNYRLRDMDQWDPSTLSILGQRTNNLSARLTHNFADGSSLDLSYDFFGDDLGQREWEKRFRAYFTKRL